MNLTNLLKFYQNFLVRVLVNKDDIYNINEEIKKYIASTYNLDETELRDIDVFSERGMFSNYIVNEIILKKMLKILYH